MSQTQIQDRVRAKYARRYREIARSGTYSDASYKIETNAQGEVVKEPPPTPRHKVLQKRIMQFLDRALSGGEAVTEFPVHTRDGTKLPDVAWFTREAWNSFSADDLALPVPLVCAQVLSPSNTDVEMAEKRRLYFEIGVEEVWICDAQGRIEVYGPSERLNASRLVANMPDSIDVAPPTTEN